MKLTYTFTNTSTHHSARTWRDGCKGIATGVFDCSLKSASRRVNKLWLAWFNFDIRKKNYFKINIFCDSKLCGSYLYCVFSDDFETLLDWTISFSERPSPTFKSFWSLGISCTRYSHNFINFSLVSFADLPFDMILQTNSSSFIKLVGLRGISLVPIISYREDKITYFFNLT